MGAAKRSSAVAPRCGSDCPRRHGRGVRLRAAGLTVAEMFGRLGESAFRERERDAVARLAAGPPRVIAAGGGAFVDEAGRAHLLASCRTVWLDAGVETLARRVGRDGGGRPLLRGRDPRGRARRARRAAAALLCRGASPGRRGRPGRGGRRSGPRALAGRR